MYKSNVITSFVHVSHGNLLFAQSLKCVEIQQSTKNNMTSHEKAWDPQKPNIGIQNKRQDAPRKSRILL